MFPIAARIVGKSRRTLASRLSRCEATIHSEVPLVSFSFDDAPTSAFETGGRILEAYGARATYYMSLALLGRDSEVGPIAKADTLARAIEDGHELGCHTFDHLDAWHTDTGAFVASVDQNRRALAEVLPGCGFGSFAYPKSGARWAVKKPLEERFRCCRGGGQTFNAGSADLNLLRACFIDRRAGLGLQDVLEIVERNADARGWLILVTHDVRPRPSLYGCTPEFLEQVVKATVDSGAVLLPVSEACARLWPSA